MTGSPPSATLVHVTPFKRLDLISIDDYLESELLAAVKHEYLGGAVYARADTTNAHNAIATAFVSILGNQLRGRPCEACNSDTKVRVRLATQTRFYYPDGMIVCRPN